MFLELFDQSRIFRNVGTVDTQIPFHIINAIASIFPKREIIGRDWNDRLSTNVMAVLPC